MQDAPIESYAYVSQANPPWHLDRIDSRVGTDSSYTYGGDGAGVHVYVLDSVIVNQEEFDDRLVQPCVDFTGSGCDAVDAPAHGTHVAGKQIGRQARIVLYTLTRSFSLTQSLAHLLTYSLTRLLVSSDCHAWNCIIFLCPAL
jgi:hypothetical protein